jgi:acetoin utilization deacetylase AcuC-like enzyme
MPAPLLRALRSAWRRFRSRGIPLVYSARYQHGLWGAPFDPLRGEKVLAALADAGLLPREALMEPRPASLANLLRVHTETYLRSLHEAEALTRILGTPVSSRAAEAVFDLQRLMVGGTIQASRVALRLSGPAVHLGGGFHHAAAGAGAGFCVFNDVAVAIARLRARGYGERILVVDLDLHDGNGTREIFAADPTVHTFSIHNDDWSAVPAIASTTIALGAGIDDERYLATLRDTLPAVVESFRPGLVFYLTGADVAHDDALGNWRLSRAGVLARDRLVTELARGHPLVIVLAGGYGPRAWRYPARYLLWLASGRSIEPAADDDIALARFRRLHLPAGDRDVRADGRPFSLTEEDLSAVQPAYSLPPRFLGTFSRPAVELQLERVGLLAQIRACGFRHLRVELAADGGLGDTLRVLCDDGTRDELIMELRAHRSRSVVPDFEVLAIEWLLLQNPRGSFSESRPRLPGQQHPGLGLLQEVLAWLIFICQEHGLDGVAFVAAHYHIAVQSRRLVRLLRAEDEALLHALTTALDGLSLADAATAVAQGRVGTGDGAPFTWRPLTAVLPVSEKLTGRVSGEAYEAGVRRSSEPIALRLLPDPEGEAARHPDGPPR